MYKALWALACLVIVGLAPPGCGGNDREDLPDGAIVKIRDHVIPRSQFDRLLSAKAVLDNPGSPLVPYTAPGFGACIAAKAGDQNRHRGTRLRRACEQDYEAAKPAALRWIIRGEWLELEARRRGLDPATPTLGASMYADFERRLGLQRQDVRTLLRTNLLDRRLNADALARAAKVPPSEIKRYYDAHQERYIEPEQRYIRSVFTTAASAPSRIRAALQEGMTWAEVAERFGARAAYNGLLVNVYRVGDEELEKVAYRAQKGQIKTVAVDDGWFVFEVAHLQPRHQQPLEDVKDEINDLLADKREVEAKRHIDARLQARYARETVCADGYTIAECD